MATDIATPSPLVPDERFDRPAGAPPGSAWEPLDGLSGILQGAFEQGRELTCEALDRGRLEQASAVAVT